MSVQLTTEVRKGLKVLDTFSLDQVKDLVDIALSVLLRESEESVLQECESLSSVASQSSVAQAYAAVVAVAIESAKRGIAGLALREVAEESVSVSANADVLVSEISAKIGQLRQTLARTSHHFPHIVDVDWRLDYVVRNDSVSTVNKPQYFISLDTERPHRFDANDGNDDSLSSSSSSLSSSSSSSTSSSSSSSFSEPPHDRIEFACSLEQLQDLVDKLKDACKQAERVSS
jgi:COMM domain containing 3